MVTWYLDRPQAQSDSNAVRSSGWDNQVVDRGNTGPFRWSYETLEDESMYTAKACLSVRA